MAEVILVGGQWAVWPGIAFTIVANTAPFPLNIILPPNHHITTHALSPGEPKPRTWREAGAPVREHGLHHMAQCGIT